ncbi:MAG: ADP compounds hydrolase NudE [Candidatus Competibacterales bacterium]
MAKLPEILKVETAAQSRLFRVERLALRFSNGVEVEFERIPSGSTIAAVIVVPLQDEGTVLLVREYAAGTHSYELGLPKGRAEPGEDLLDAANRELMEEIGFGAERLEHLTALSIAPNYIGHRTQVILARDLYPKRLPGDEPEPLEVVPWSLDDLEALVAREDFSEARSLAALYLVRDRLARRG